jgi:hypothetical protein
MRTIWKYPIIAPGRVSHEIPGDVEILTVQAQGGVPCVWALVDPNAPKRRRYFWVYATGDSIPGGQLLYVGTFQLSDGRLVYHVFLEVEA